MKYLPRIGDKLYLRTSTGLFYVDYCKDPYTVIGLNRNKAGDIVRVVIQECSLIFYGDRYYDTLPDEILANPCGKTKELRWNEKYGRWIETPAQYGTKNAKFAIFGEWIYQPYLD